MILARITIVTSKDFYGRALEQEFQDRHDVSVVFNSLAKPGRVLKLFRRGSVSVRFLLRAVVCRLKDFRILPRRLVFSGDSDLRHHLEKSGSEVLIMFRMGLIVPAEILSNFYVVNVHVARLPTYSGLGSILSALDARDLNQVATAHEAVGRIDSGAVLAEFPYTLDPLLSYCRNERNAYAAGIEAVKEMVARLS